MLVLYSFGNDINKIYKFDIKKGILYRYGRGFAFSPRQKMVSTLRDTYMPALSKSMPKRTKRRKDKRKKKKYIPTIKTNWMSPFLEHLRVTLSVAESARLANVSMCNVFARRASDPDFAKAWESVIQGAAYEVESLAWQRAREGIDEPVFFKGSIVGHVKRFNPTREIFLMKSKLRESYGDNLTGSLNPEDQARLAIQYAKLLLGSQDADSNESNKADAGNDGDGESKGGEV